MSNYKVYERKDSTFALVFSSDSEKRAMGSFLSRAKKVGDVKQGGVILINGENIILQSTGNGKLRAKFITDILGETVPKYSGRHKRWLLGY